MQVLLHEFYKHLKNFGFYVLGIVFLIGAGLVKGEGFIKDPAAIDKIFSQFPKSFLAIFGMNGFNISTINGYYGLLFFYIVVIGYAGNLGVHIFADEEVDKTSEFLYTKPISRTKLFINKYVAGVIYLVLFNLVILVLSEVIITKSMMLESILPMIVICCVSLFITQWLFFSLGVMLVSSLRKLKKAYSVISTIVMVSYMLYIIKDFSVNLEWLKWITPLSYLDLVNIAKSGEYAIPTLTVAVVASIAFSIYGLIQFRQRDIYL